MPVLLATLNKSKAGWVLVPWTVKVASAVVVPSIAEPLTPTLKREMPVEELIWKGFKVVVPWTNREVVELEALTPATVPLSMRAPVERVLGEVQRATKPLVPLPVT